MKLLVKWIAIGLGFLIFAFVALIVIGSNLPVSDEQKRKQEARRILNDAIWKMRTTSTPEQRSSYGRALRQIGWNCPDVKSIRWDDDDANGQHAQVMCGPNDGSGNVYKDRIFGTTLRSNGKFEAKQVGLYD